MKIHTNGTKSLIGAYMRKRVIEREKDRGDIENKKESERQTNKKRDRQKEREWKTEDNDRERQITTGRDRE